MTGQLVSTIALDGTSKAVHTDDWPVGVYTLKISYEDRQIVQRLLILN